MIVPLRPSRSFPEQRSRSVSFLLWSSLFWTTLLSPLLLSLACEKPGHTAASAAAGEGWIRKRSLEGGPSVYLRKESGHRAYFIYVPFGRSGMEELNDIDDRILASGWDILTMEAEDGGTLSDASVVEFMRYALETPGLTGRIAAVPGRRLGAALEGTRESFGVLSGLVVIRPGDAPFHEPGLNKAVKSLAHTLPILWIHSGYLPESAYAEQYAALLQIPASGRMILTRLAAAKPEDGLPKELADDTFMNFLALVRQPVQWNKAETVFVNGCTPDGYWKLNLTGYTVSAAREADFCPLLLKLPDGRLMRAHEITEHGCRYTLPGAFPNLRCRY